MDKKEKDDDKEYKLGEILVNDVPDLKNIEGNEKSKKKKIIIIVIIIISVLIFISIGIILYFTLRKGSNNSNGNLEPSDSTSDKDLEPSDSTSDKEEEEDDDPKKIPIAEKYYFDPNEEIKSYTINDENIKLGIISDFQLDLRNEDYKRNVRETLNKMKNENVDVIIMAGDIVDNGYPDEYVLYKNILNSVYTNENEKPLIFEIMGNHEYYTTKYSVSGYYLKKNIQLFKDNFGKFPFYHVKINGFHFIFWSMQNHDTREQYTIHTTWLQKHLDIAENDLQQKGDPIFIVTHAPPKNTVYGSDEDSGLVATFNLLKNYENAFCISGHSHRSLRNEKSIWQGEFTGINTQSLSYMALSRKFENTSDIVENSTDSYMGYIATLNHQKMEIQRYFFHVDKQIDPWVVSFPLQKDNFNFTDENRKMIFGVPRLWNHTIDTTEINNGYQIKYYQAWHDLAIHYYIFKYVTKNRENKELLIYGNYYLYNYISNSTEPRYFTVRDIDITEKYSLSAVDFFQNKIDY